MDRTEVPRAAPRPSLGAIFELRPRGFPLPPTPFRTRQQLFLSLHVLYSTAPQLQRGPRQRYLVKVAGFIERLFQPVSGLFSIRVRLYRGDKYRTATSDSNLKVVEPHLANDTVAPPQTDNLFMPRR